MYKQRDHDTKQLPFRPPNTASAVEVLSSASTSQYLYFYIKFRERSFVQIWNVMRFPIQNHHDAACFHPLVTTNDFSFLTLYKRNGEEKTSLKLKLVKGAREWSTKSSSTLNSNECNYVPAAPCKAARLAIDPFENQIKSNWNAVLAEQLGSDLNLCKKIAKAVSEDFLESLEVLPFSGTSQVDFLPSRFSSIVVWFHVSLIYFCFKGKLGIKLKLITWRGKQKIEIKK